MESLGLLVEWSSPAVSPRNRDGASVDGCVDCRRASSEERRTLLMQRDERGLERGSKRFFIALMSSYREVVRGTVFVAGRNCMSQS